MDINARNTEEDIIFATLRVLQREGFEKATTKKIAAEAGVNEVTIFRKFENKKNLIEITKKYFLDLLVDTLDEIFDFNEDLEIEEYLKHCFFSILNLSDDDFSILKIAMEEVREVSEKKLLISEITDAILNKLDDFFKLQIDKGIVKEIDTRSLAVMCFSILFQSVILWKIYDKSLGFETDHYIEDMLDILFEGIRV